MTMTQAIRKAQNVARKLQAECYVVYSPGEMGILGNDYHTASLEDTETFFDGAPIVAYISSSGEVEEVEGRRLAA